MNTQARRFHVIALRRSARGIAPHLLYDEWLVGCQFRGSLYRASVKASENEPKINLKREPLWTGPQRLAPLHDSMRFLLLT